MRGNRHKKTITIILGAVGKLPKRFGTLNKLIDNAIENFISLIRKNTPQQPSKMRNLGNRKINLSVKSTKYF